MLSKDTSEKIFEICNGSNIGIYIYMISAVKYILKVYSNNNEIVIGTEAIAKGKNDKAPYAKILMFKSTINEENTFKEFLVQSKEMFVNINKFNSLDIQDIQRLVGVEEFDDKTAIIDTVVRLNNISSNREIEGFKVSTIFEFEVEEKNIICSIKYNVDSISKWKINAIENHFINFLNQVTFFPDIKLKMIDLVLGEEKTELISLGSGIKISYNEIETIVDLFDKQVERTPNNVAVVFEDQKLTYKTLDEKSNSLARILRDKEVKSNTIVGIIGERSLEMIIGILAILKAGGAYLPLDPRYPKERMEYILDDSKTNILLTMGNLVEGIKFDGEIIDLFNEKLYEADSNRLEKINGTEDLIYIIYTSGTTGKPKGTMVKRGSFNNLIKWYSSEFKMGKNDNVLLMSSVGFDLSQKNIYAPLVVGGKLTLANKGLINYETINRIISEEKITIINCAPSAFNPIIELNKDTNYEWLKSLKYVFLGGEVININKLNEWRNSGNCNAEIVNMYGPTECTDIATFYRITNQKYNSVPIGKSINNVNVYILNEDKRLLPIGVFGELYISGEGISKGYLNKENLTKEKFVDNPFEIGMKMYKTGDLARWIPSGEIEYIGRIDNQVKIRGFRIELEEIENKILQHEDINDATVVIKKSKDDNVYICAYLVSDKSLKELNLSNYLKRSLPDYMIPTLLTLLDKMPITVNGKVDKRALPEQNFNDNLSEYEAPRNEIEEKLVEIWAEVLKLKNIGIKDNFFDLGGNSLSAMVLVSKIQKSFQVNILITDILELMTIKNISKYIYENINEYSYKPLINVEKREFYPVSSSQKRMFVLQNLNPLDIAYNDQLVKRIKGEVDIKKLEESFLSLIKRHEALRTSFILNKEEVVQIISNNINFNIDIIEQENNNIDDLIADFVQPFDLSKAPLMRVGIIKSQGYNYIMILDIHHICTDAITMKILTNELSQLYNGEILSSIEFQYKDFACWQKDLLQTSLIQAQKKYWYNNLCNYNFKSNIFNKCSLNYRNDGRLKQTKFSIGAMLKSQLEYLSRSKEVTLYVILLTAYNILLYRFSEEEDIIIGTPIAGRHHANLDTIVGVFINTLPVRSFANYNKTVGKLLNEVKETMSNVFKNQDYPFEEIVNDLNIERSANENPLFNTMFTLNNINYKELNLLKMEVEEYNVNKSGLMMDILLEAENLNNELIFTFEYNDMIFSKKLIDKFIYNYIKILRNIMNYDIKICDIDLEKF